MHNNHNTAVDNFQGENQRILYIIKNNPRRREKGSPPRGALDEDIPDQQHVGDRAGGDGEEDVALPEVEAGGDEDADELRQAVAVAAEGDGSQAVDDQHRKNGAGQNFPEILHECRCLSVLIEDQKRYEPRQLRAEHAQGDGDDLLGKSHCRYRLSAALG